MGRRRRAMDQKLLEAEIATENGLAHPEILERLEEWNFGKERLLQGREYRLNAKNSRVAKNQEYAEQYGATDAFEEKWDEADYYIGNVREIAKKALKGDLESLEKLALAEPKKDTFSGWTDQFGQFISVSLQNQDIQDKLAVLGISPEKLKKCKRLYEEVMEAKLQQESERGDAQDSTRQQDAAFEMLDDWMDTYKAVAVVALDDRPEFLEKLGFLHRSG